jgi:hypothetical protein
MRRFTRLTNAFSKKFENQAYMLAIYFVHYNWMRKHKTLGTTPAIAADSNCSVLIDRNIERPATPAGGNRAFSVAQPVEQLTKVL